MHLETSKAINNVPTAIYRKIFDYNRMLIVANTATCIAGKARFGNPR